MPDDLSAAERMVREWQQRATEKAEKFGQMQAAIQSITVTESSQDGAVQVTVGSNGILQDLQLSDSAANRSMSALASEIMRTVQKAQAKLPELMQEAAASTVGLEDSAVQHVLGKAREAFPQPPEEQDDGAQRYSGPQEIGFDEQEDVEQSAPDARRSGPQRRRPDDFDDDDEDFSDQSFLR
ncbi:YbaB/EbfC family nucleoid-associated protein [Saccharopolyspora rectivirgula]|uniref:YbaB/EbfC DNA-binding family protein n=1 Tax=Saccharopolyspora rectivirgula TaxID=28042 RepID=A0A073B1T2_9PSEU|nr:YbaB/EbfC family nucleoid-associated protein [Saccharopolyspora rectivirgula]KEI45227.1 hypothetical protein GU90_05435 [Saccharopolyspora rectivirgula]